MRCSITDLVHRGAVAHGLADDVAHLEEECISANHSRAAAESGKKPFHSVRGPPSIVGTIPNRFPVFRSATPRELITKRRRLRMHHSEVLAARIDRTVP